jgi:hypothetical protein
MKIKVSQLNEIITKIVKEALVGEPRQTTRSYPAASWNLLKQKSRETFFNIDSMADKLTRFSRISKRYSNAADIAGQLYDLSLKLEQELEALTPKEEKPQP